MKTYPPSIEKYISYLLSEPIHSSCVKASQVVDMSHDKVGRILFDNQFSGKDLFDNVKDHLDLAGGCLAVDDSILDKHYSDEFINELVGFFYSGKHHKTVKGVCLIALVYTDKHGVSFPVNFRVYRHKELKTKHDYFQEMCKEVRAWGLNPSFVTADSWYSSIESLKFLREWGVNFLVGVEKNRTVSTAPRVYQQAGSIDIPDEGLYTHLKKFDFVKLFRTVYQDNRARHYVVYIADQDQLKAFSREEFKALKQTHWKIENTFRALKQVCQIERFFVRRADSVLTHIFSALTAFQRLNLMIKHGKISTVYEFKKSLFLGAQRAFVHTFA